MVWPGHVTRLRVPIPNSTTRRHLGLAVSTTRWLHHKECECRENIYYGARRNTLIDTDISLDTVDKLLSADRSHPRFSADDTSFLHTTRTK